MKIVLLFAMVLVAISTIPVNAQEEQKCESMEFGDSLHTPFRIAINHDPAIRQLVEETHSDPLSVLSFDKTEKTFSIYSNSTDDWSIRVDLGFKDILPLEQKREIVFDITSDNNIFVSQKRYSFGNDYCVFFRFFATVPPHIPSTQEIFELAGEYQEQYFKDIITRFDQSILLLAQSENANTAIVFFVLSILIILGLSKLFDRKRKKKTVDNVDMLWRKLDWVILKFKSVTDSYRPEIQAQVNSLKPMIESEMAQIRNTLINMALDSKSSRLVVPETRRVDDVIQEPKKDQSANEVFGFSIPDLKSVPSKIQSVIKRDKTDKTEDDYYKEFQKLYFSDQSDHAKGMEKIRKLYDDLHEKSKIEPDDLEVIKKINGLAKLIDEEVNR
jgi:hypothetical protein